MHALIFAAGEGVRWDGETVKQMMTINDEPIIHRTVRQLKERGVNSTIVANDKTITAPGARVVKPSESRWLVETIIATESLWDGEMLGVLGDVFFTNDAMDALCALKGLKWFGRKEQQSHLTGGPGEVFAISWDEGTRHTLMQHLEAEHARCVARYPHTQHLDGSLWQPYRTLVGFRHDVHGFEHTHWVNHYDWTDDFDSQGRWNIWRRRYQGRFIKNGLPITAKKPLVQEEL